MLDIKFVRENTNKVKENIKNKFQNEKLPLVDEVICLDKDLRETKTKADNLRNQRNSISTLIGSYMRDKKVEEANIQKENVKKINEELVELEQKEEELSKKVKDIMMVIPNIIDDTVPIGKDDSENVELEKFGKKKECNFEIPYHTDIMEKLDGIDLDSARKISGNGFYFLTGDIARLHSAVLAYARDFMINKGFTYCIPPFMINSASVDGVMSFAERDNMMYKIEGEDLYLIGTSEHSMIARFMDTIIKEEKLPIIIMGDFNATPDSKIIKKFAAGEYSTNRFVAVQEVKKELYSKSTMSSFKGKEKGLHIDYIFVSEDLEIVDVDIVKDNINGKYPSDHYPLIADIKIKK